jgi:hypothetical protein
MTPYTWLRSCGRPAEHHIRRATPAGPHTEDVCTEHLSDAQTWGDEPEAEDCDLTVDELWTLAATLGPSDRVGVDLPPRLAAAVRRTRGRG